MNHYLSDIEIELQTEIQLGVLCSTRQPNQETGHLRNVLDLQYPWFRLDTCRAFIKYL